MSKPKKIERTEMRRRVRAVEYYANGFPAKRGGLFLTAFATHEPFEFDEESGVSREEQEAIWHWKVAEALHLYKFGVAALGSRTGNKIEGDFIPEPVAKLIPRLMVKEHEQQDDEVVKYQGKHTGRRQMPAWATACAA